MGMMDFVGRIKRLKEKAMATKPGHQPGGKVGPKRTPEQRIIDQHEMVKMLRRGYTKTFIANELGISPAQITYDWKRILQALRQERIELTWAEVSLKLEQYAEVRVEAWESWEKSKLPAIKDIEEDTVGDDGKAYVKVSRTTTYRTGDKGYLMLVLECLQAERELLALDPPKSMKIQANVINWDILAGQLPQGPVPDEIEEEIQKAMLVHDKALDEAEISVIGDNK